MKAGIMRKSVMAALAITVFGAPASAQNVCVAITAKIAEVSDPLNATAGAIPVGGVITGSYVYDASTPDTNPASLVADYKHYTAPFGIVLSAGGYVFRTNPSSPYFVVEIANNHGALDNYLLRSYVNLFDLSVPDEVENHIAWQLDDSTTSALSSVALPSGPPVLANWQSLFGLTIESFNDDDALFIRAHVTSAVPCGETGFQKSAVCHKPGTRAQQTMFVSASAALDHLRHGDALGQCR